MSIFEMEGMEVMDEREWGDALDERYLIDRQEHEAHAEGNEEPDDDFNDCGHDRARRDDIECPECGADLAAMDDDDEPETHLAYNPHTDRHETGGDEIEFADESEYRD